MTEWEFTGDVVSWINEALSRDPDLPFYRAKCEQRGKGSQKRRDVTLLDRHRRACLTGEIKLPYRQDGNSPFVDSVVDDARKKAQRAQSRFFFTWNVNQCVLWETTPGKESLHNRNYQSWLVVSINRESQLENPITENAIKHWLVKFLHDFARILRGTSPIGFKSPDQKFIEALESSLSMPILMSIEELAERYKKKKFKTELDKWMRVEQGWTIFDDADGIRDNLERASKFACYALVNKLVFYEALLKRYGTKMEKFAVPEHIDTGDGLRIHLESYFATAKEVTGDYETVFGEDHYSIESRIPFYSDNAAIHWRALINQIHEFDFSKLDYEIIGGIFERLIAPEERRKYGQFYTRVEVVDLINSFCIQDGTETIMDPACGGGTFLVRAYARKKELCLTRSHAQRIAELYGVDLSHFATHLTTINLATRDLVDAENYPQILRSNFFDVLADKTFIVLPRREKSKGLGKLQHREVAIPPLDAVVGNPPYVRQEEIPRARQKPAEPGTKDYYRKLVADETGVALSGRSDIHCYFWPHAASFLKDDGYLCLLTSSQWLDVEYGFRLQDWILRNFQVVAILESFDEPWFVGARVATTVTILRKQKDERLRMENLVRFIQLRRPIADILAHDGTTAGAMASADQFREEILSLTINTVNRRFRARLVGQDEMWKHGVQLGAIMGKTQPVGNGEDDEASGVDQYFGGKWGIHLRAPDVWFRLIELFGNRVVPLGEIAQVRFGVKSGKDCFFFPKDCTQKCLDGHPMSVDFESTFGVPRRLVESGGIKLVLCGEGRGEIRPIESNYLEPEVHSLMEVKGFSVTPEDCSRSILLVDKRKDQLEGQYVLRYIEWGEEQGYHAGSTCSSRATKDRCWYDLTGHARGSLFWPMAQQYKHVVPVNDRELICNHNLFDIHVPETIDRPVMAGILNSSFVILSKFQYGRPVGVEGNLKTEVVDVNMLLVPDPRIAKKSSSTRIAKAFREMMKRKPLQLLSERRMREMAYRQAGKEDQLEDLSAICELDMDDRRELDDAVLEMLGVKSKRERRRLIDEVYGYLREFFEWTRQKEEKAIQNKKRSKRKGPATASEIASQVFQSIADQEGGLLRRYEPDFLDASKPFDTYEVPSEGSAEVYSDMLVPHAVRFVGPKKKSLALVETRVSGQEVLLALVANTARRTFIRVPHRPAECKRVLKRFEVFLQQRGQRLRELIEERTADDEMQEKVYDALLLLLSQGRRL
jgi:hypothetical protein